MGAQSGKLVLKLDEGNATIRESGKLENATIRGTATRSTCMRLRGRSKKKACQQSMKFKKNELKHVTALNKVRYIFSSLPARLR